jgi:hypothetical protein
MNINENICSEVVTYSLMHKDIEASIEALNCLYYGKPETEKFSENLGKLLMLSFNLCGTGAKFHWYREDYRNSCLEILPIINKIIDREDVSKRVFEAVISKLTDVVDKSKVDKNNKEKYK